MSGSTLPQSEGNKSATERRTGPNDRRKAAMDRRNEDRVADDPLPRRNPDVPDRRQS